MGLSGKKMHLAKDAIPSKFAWRTSLRKRPPPSNRSSEVPEKRKRLEGLFTSEEDENVIEDPTLHFRQEFRFYNGRCGFKGA